MALKKPMILLIEDDANDEELAKIALDETNIEHDLLIKRDGSQVLQWIDEVTNRNPEGLLPDMILLDLKIPKITGLEVLEKIRNHEITKNMPVIIFTSSLEDRDVKKSYELGTNAYLRKPVDFKEYRKTVGDMARFWILRNQLPYRTSTENPSLND